MKPVLFNKLFYFCCFVILSLCLHVFASEGDESPHNQTEYITLSDIYSIDDMNFHLLFDRTTGKVIFGYLPLYGKTNTPKNLIVNFRNFFSDHLEIDCFKSENISIPNSYTMGFMGPAFSTLPGRVTNADHRVSVPTNGLHGITIHLWETRLWNPLQVVLNQHETVKIFNGLNPSYRQYIMTDGKESDPRYYSEISRKTYAHLSRYKKKAKIRPFTVLRAYNEDDRNYRRNPVQLSKSKSGMLKTHGPDHNFQILLDRDSGLLATFLEYADTSEPRDLNILKIARRVDPNSLLAAPYDYWTSGSAQKDTEKKGILRASDKTWKNLGHLWRQSLKEAPNPDTSFSIRRDTVFGTAIPIWELEIWVQIVERMKTERKIFLLFFNEEDVEHLKRPTISQDYLVITPEIVNEISQLKTREETQKKAEKSQKVWEAK